MKLEVVAILLIGAGNASVMILVGLAMWRITRAVETLSTEIKNMNAQIQKIVDDTAAIKTVAQSATNVLNAIPQMIKDAVAQALANNPTLTPDDLAAVTQVATDLESTAGALATAVTANTPAAPAPTP